MIAKMFKLWLKTIDILESFILGIKYFLKNSKNYIIHDMIPRTLSESLHSKSATGSGYRSGKD